MQTGVKISGTGLYDSIRDDAPYDHNNKSDRYGIISAKFVKQEGKLPIPSVSIIVPVYNEESTLPLCLESIQALDYPKDRYEVIVVDNGSTDTSVEIAEKYGAKVLHENSVKSSYAARNKGITEANGELIAFTDSDCIVTPSWLTHIIKEWDDKSIGCFAGEIKSYQPQTIVEIFSDRTEILSQKWTLSCPYLPYTQTANSAYRKEVFDKIGLFIPLISGGDGEMSWRMQNKLGLRIKFIPEAIVYHRHRNSVIGLFKQYQKYEIGKLSWIKYYPDYPIPSTQQRFLEFIEAFKICICSFPLNILMFLLKRIDSVAFFHPFLVCVMAAGTFSARLINTKIIHDNQYNCLHS